MATTIGELLVKITGSETGLTSSINNAEKSVKGLGAATETTAKGSGFQSIFQGVGLGVGLFAMNAAVSAISDVTGVISNSIGVAEADETAMTKLNQALQDAGIAATGESAAFEDARTAGANLGFITKDLIDAQALLVTGTKSVSNANIALQAAEDLARLKGIDLGTAVTAVNKLFNGSATAITRMGIAIPKGAKGLEAIADLEKAAGGQAQAFADTTAGSVDVMNAKWDELQGKLGQDLIPVFSELVNVGTSAVDVLNSMTNPIDDLKLSVPDATDKFNQQKTAIDELGNSFLGTLIPSLHVAAIQADQTAQGVADLQNQLNLTPDATRTTGKGFEDMAAAVDTSVGTAVDTVDTKWTPIADVLLTPIQKARNSIITLMEKMPTDIAGALKSGESNITSEATTLAADLKHPLSLAAQEATLQGELNNKNLVAGLKSTDPLIRAEAEKMKQDILDQMNLLQATADTYGLNTGKAYGDGLASASQYVAKKASEMTGAAAAKLRANSPPAEGPLHLIDQWGERTGIAWADGLAKGLGTSDGALAGVNLGAPSMPGVSGAAMGSLGGGSPFAGATIVVQVGNEKLAEITDRQLFQQGRIYAPGIPSQTLGAPTR